MSNLGITWIAANSLKPDDQAVLVIAHPGHELAVYSWLELVKPTVLIFTDGSGHTTRSRLASSTKILQQTAATPGSIYGRFSDRMVYDAILAQDLAFFEHWKQELVETFVRERVKYVVGDAMEGYNPVHDMCRFAIDAAIATANRIRSAPIINFDISLTSPPQDCPDPETSTSKGIWIKLDRNAWERKYATALAYSELAGELNTAIDRFGLDAFQVEHLRLVNAEWKDPWVNEVPFYEHYGKKQVAAGYFQQVILYRQHILPIAAALQECVRSGK